MASWPRSTLRLTPANQTCITIDERTTVNTFLGALEDTALIVSTLLVLFALIAAWGWLFKNFGTF